MRTTLTIDDDVAAELEALRRTRRASLKATVNEVLRRGLREQRRAAPKDRPFRTRVYDVGRVLVSIDNVVEALAAVEGDHHR